MIFGVMFAGAVVVKTASAADCDLGTVTLKQGMSGTAVTCLQTKLAVTPMTGYFGTITKGKVIAFQSANQLVADGIVGNLTKAALGMVSGGGTFPAGCTSNTGFSVTTGLSCSAAALPAGCTSNVGFSPTTGVSCSTGTTGSTSLSGGAGDVDSVDQVTTSVKNEVLEDEQDVKVLGFDVTADNGSDLGLTSIRLEFENQGVAAASTHLDRYIDEVTVWMGSTKVGSADADDFSESNDVYSKSITLSNVVIEAGEDVRLYVAVSANSTIDSTDQVANDWIAELINIRTVDASGAIITFDPGSDVGTGSAGVFNDFGFSDLASSGDLAFKVARASTSPIAQSVEVDDSSETDVKMLEFKLTAEGSDMIVDEIPFTLDSVGANLDVMISEIKLMNGTDELDSVNGSTLAAGILDTVTFTDLSDDLTIEDGDSVTLKVVATVVEVDGAPLVNGDSLKVSLTAADRAAMDIEDANGDTIGAGDRSGSASGAAQSFFAEGLAITDITKSAVVSMQADSVGETSQGKFTFTFKVSAFGKDIYLVKADEDVDGYDGGAGNGAGDLLEGVVYTIDGGTPSVAGATFECVSNCGLIADNTPTGFYIADGDTETYRLTVNITGDVAATDDFKVWIDSLNWDLDGATGDLFYSSNFGEGTDVDSGFITLTDM